MSQEKTLKKNHHHHLNAIITAKTSTVTVSSDWSAQRRKTGLLPGVGVTVDKVVRKGLSEVVAFELRPE